MEVSRRISIREWYMTLEKQPLLPQWYTDRFVRPTPKENPADQNVSLVRNTFTALVGRAILKPDHSFSLEHPITLVTKRSEEFTGSLHYSLRRGTVYDQCYLVAELQIVQKKKWVSRRTWYIDVLDEARIGYYVDISSGSETKGIWEGNRFGSSLLLLTNDVITHLLRHNTHFDELAVRAMITDGAAGQFPRFKYRHGWTSHYAALLGYTNTEKNDFEKWYRVTDRGQMRLPDQRSLPRD